MNNELEPSKIEPVLTFTNPYATTGTKRVTTYLPDSEWNLIRCIRPNTGTISGTVGLLIKSLCEELQSRGITDVGSQNEFESLLVNCKIITKHEYAKYLEYQRVVGGPAVTGGGLSNRTLSRPYPLTDAPNDPGATPFARDEHTATPSELSDVQSGSGTKRKGKSGGSGK